MLLRSAQPLDRDDIRISALVLNPSAGLPVGLQIVAPIYQDSRALQAAHAFQTAYPTTDRRPPLD